MFIETHAHLTMPEYSDLTSVLARAKEAKIETIINASFDLPSSRRSLELAQNYPNYIYAAIGIHPHDAGALTAETLAELKKLALNKEVVAIGETGLDYHLPGHPKEVQEKAFRQHLSLAQEMELPVIVHTRDSQEDTIRIIREENRGNLRGVFHCFAGNEGLIEFASNIGFYISFAGMLTFKKADKARENLKKVPLSQLLLETDCPYLAPEPFRGKRNEPAYLSIIAQKIAEVKEISVEEISRETTSNAKKIFKV